MLRKSGLKIFELPLSEKARTFNNIRGLSTASPLNQGESIIMDVDEDGEKVHSGRCTGF